MNTDIPVERTQEVKVSSYSSLAQHNCKRGHTLNEDKQKGHSMFRHISYFQI